MNQSTNRIHELNEENKKLRQRLNQLEKIINTEKMVVKWAGLIGLWFTIGPNLTTSIKNYLDDLSNVGTSTTQTKAELIAAIIRRIFYVGIIGFLAILLPAMLLIWQNIEIRKQSEILITQIKLQKEMDIRKTLFGEVRQKQEAIKIFLQQLKENLKKGDRIDLTGIVLSGTVLSNMDLSDAIFSRAYVISTIFLQTNLNNTDFSFSRCTAAKFDGANLSGANFNRADLTLSTFKNSNLIGANFSGTVLISANFSGANIKDVNFNGACFSPHDSDSPTIWPDSFNPLDHGLIPNCDRIMVDNL